MKYDSYDLDRALYNQTFVSSCALARLSTAMAKKTFSSVSVMKQLRTNRAGLSAEH